MRYKYSVLKNPWVAHGGRMTVQQAFRHWIRIYKPAKANSLAAWRYERELASFRGNRKRNRSAIGAIRAFGTTTFFNGAYRGAEHD